MDFVEDAVLNAEVYACGVVQGVGFRPFVARLAGELGITGAVWNEGGDVRARLFGPADAIAAFCDRLPRELPPGAALRAFSCDTRTPADGETAPARFSIAESGGRADGPIMPAPDLATCPACLAELFTPGDPRHQNPFISCTHCGPRYSILHRVPYDRPNTSMAAFDLCPLCGRQYRDPVDRRFHAQTVCCNDCGPTLRYHGRDARHAGGAAALEAAVSALGAGGIVAVKGIGGYHLACDPYDEGAVARLRLLKGREYKPFAVMFPDLASLRAHCRTTGAENELLSSPAAPIVLVPAAGRRLAAGVCAGSDEVGA
ncbi:MAG: carbamoyltransferase HypF, partial [Clostridiales bacterium]|nr:carbamoyltransferase HypF [Clostridiales bacterium]